MDGGILFIQSPGLFAVYTQRAKLLLDSGMERSFPYAFFSENHCFGFRFWGEDEYFQYGVAHILNRSRFSNQGSLGISTIFLFFSVLNSSLDSQGQKSLILTGVWGWGNMQDTCNAMYGMKSQIR